MGRRVALLGVVLVPLLTIGAGRGRTQVSYGWTVTPISATEKWLRINNDDPSGSLKVVAIRGDDFTITGIKSVRASGAATPPCSISPGSQAILRCDGTLPPGASLFVNFTVAGSGGNFEVAASDDPTQLHYAPDTQGTPFLPMDATLTRTGATTKRVTFTSQGNAFDELEVLPFNFTITKVTSITPGGSCQPEGSGIDCTSISLPANATGVATFETAGASDQTPAAEVLLTGDDGSGDKTVTETQGTPSASYDLVASIRPASVQERPGQRIPSGTDVMNVSVANAKTSRSASDAATATVKLSGAAAQALFGTSLSCQGFKAAVPALAPGASRKICSLQFRRYPVTVKKPGRIDVTLTVTCVKDLEKSCANNHARASIVVKA